MLENYRKVSETTMCPFAKKAEIVVVPTTDNTAQIAQALQTELPTLTPRKIDAALVTLPNLYTNSLEAVGEGLQEIIYQMDQSSLESVEESDWRLRLYGEKYFLATFWEGFPVESPRRTDEGAFILFQPKSSFERKFRNPEQEARIRSNIRRKFALDGKPYEHADMLEAERFLPGSNWWNSNKIK